MDIEKKLSILKEIFEMDDDKELSPDMYLSDIEEYSSMSQLALIVCMSEEYGKVLTSSHLREFVTVKDILDFMN